LLRPLDGLGDEQVPLLPSASGTASFSMEPSHYAPVKEELADLRVGS
jgi:hypothetical protein